jgi:hypothetical protein
MARWLDQVLAQQRAGSDTLHPADTPPDPAAPLTRPPSCRDATHGDHGWWHVVDGIAFCTAWACQPEHQPWHQPLTPPVPALPPCGDQTHRDLWHIIAGGRVVCLSPQHHIPRHLAETLPAE